MKTTTTIEDIIRSEMKDRGFNDFVDPNTGLLIEQGDPNSIIKQVATWQDPVKSICETEIFGSYDLQSENADEYFKHMFTTHFLNREIAFQTLDLFRNKLVGMLAMNDQYISLLYDNFYKIFAGGGDSEAEDSMHNEFNGRSANVTLPQDNTELNLDDLTVDYADTTNADHNKQDQTQKHTRSSNQFNASVLAQLNNQYARKLDEFDRALFLQVW